MPGAPVVPAGDPTLMFTSAGMVQFKPYFMGQATPPHNRLVSVQKCFRTTDIESVGDTSHLTFFEMLGNFSVADYFKAEIIPWAQEFLTQRLGLPQGRLWPAVFQDDDEAFDLWRAQGYPAERIMRYGEEDNYWFSGDVGPCGPDSEIHYDFGEEFGCGPDCHPSHGHDRFVEIWNLVFMSFYCDGKQRTPLPSNNVDTGSGLERVASVLLYDSPGWDKRRLATVYDTDLFQPIIRRVEELSGKRYGGDPATDRAIRVVAEHCRSVTFLIGDERTPVTPSNEERGYVVRRMLRRAIYFGRRGLGIKGEFVGEVADAVIDTMAPAYPELDRQRRFVREILAPEERRFDETLNRGLEMLEAMANYRADHRTALTNALAFMESQNADPENATAILEQYGFTVGRGAGDSLAAEALVERISAFLSSMRDGDTKLARLQKVVVQGWPNSVSGREAFLLHDTYGFPIELTREIVAEHGLTVDESSFEQEMDAQRARARASAGGADAVAADALYASLTSDATDFLGYEKLESSARVVGLLTIADGLTPVEAAEALAEAVLLLDATPFYPEGGGQVGDRGEIVGPNGRVGITDTQRVAEKLIIHRGRVTEGRISAGDEVTASVDAEHRTDTMRNHTATHLLHAALRQVLGTHVRQKGSLVAPNHLRFDFTHTEAISPEQLTAVETLVNDKVRQNIPVSTRMSTFDQAIDDGVLAFFGDKYGAEVRVVEVNSVVPRFSAELCGGTHCYQTGDIGAVIITGESSIGSGMRRIEALTGRGAEAHIRTSQATLQKIARKLGVPRDAVPARLDALVAEMDSHRKKIEKLERSMASGGAAGGVLGKAIDVDGVPVVSTTVDAPSMDSLRYFADSTRRDLKSGVAVLASEVEGCPQFVSIVTPDVVARGVHAGNLLKRVATVAGGGGGGRPDMAQGGGKDISKIGEALAIVPAVVREMLAAGE